MLSNRNKKHLRPSLSNVEDDMYNFGGISVHPWQPTIYHNGRTFGPLIQVVPSKLYIKKKALWL